MSLRVVLLNRLCLVNIIMLFFKNGEVQVLTLALSLQGQSPEIVFPVEVVAIKEVLRAY